MSDIKVRVGQTNTVRIVSSVSGTAGGRAIISENVIGGIGSITALNVSGISTFSDIYATGLVGINTVNQSTSRLWVEGDTYISGVITASRIYSNVYGELTGGPIQGTSIVGTAMSVSGISTYANGPVLIGTATTTGDSLQVLQVLGNTYINGLVDINGVLGFSKNNVLIGNFYTGLVLTPKTPYEFSGVNNIFIGNYAGGTTSSGYHNIFLGSSSGYSNSTGYYNTLISADSGFSNTTGSYNTFLGNKSGFSNLTGSNNTFYGSYSGYSNLIGSNNIFLGSHNGISTNFSNKVIIGSGYFDFGTNQSYLFDSPNTIKEKQFAIGVRTDTGSSNYWLVGNENFNIGIGTTNPTSKLYVVGDTYITGILTANRIVSSLYGEFTGSVSASNIVGTSLSVSGISTLNTVSVASSFYYVPSNTNGIAYFDSNDLMVSTGSTNSSIEYTNYILTTDNSGIPTWSTVIDGGSY
jgi:hypothetical protein